MFGKLKLRPDDILFSKYLRAKRKWKCEKCGRQFKEGDRTLHNSHYWGRKAESVRFSEINCDVLCFYDHNYFEQNPSEYHEWKLKKLGEKEYNKLKLSAHLYCRKDIKKNLLIIRELIKNENN